MKHFAVSLEYFNVVGERLITRKKRPRLAEGSKQIMRDHRLSRNYNIHKKKCSSHKCLYEIQLQEKNYQFQLLVDKNQYQNNLFHSPFFIFLNNYLKLHRKQFPMGTRENKFKAQINCANTGKNFIISFISLQFQVFHTKFNICVAINDLFLRRYTSQSYKKFAIRCKLSWKQDFVHLLLERLIDSLLIILSHILNVSKRQGIYQFVSVIASIYY